MNEFIHALLIEPGKTPRMVILENSMTAFQAMIQGRGEISCKELEATSAAFIKSEKREDSIFNRVIIDQNHIPVDLIWDPFLIVGRKGPGEFTSLAPNAMMMFSLFFAVPDKLEKMASGEMHISKVIPKELMPDEDEED